MTTPMKTEGVEPDYYNPAKDEAKLQAAMVDPLPFDGWPSRWKRCLAVEVLELRTALTASEKRIELLESALRTADNAMTCRDDESACYCPNCDRSKYNDRAAIRAAMEKANG